MARRRSKRSLRRCRATRGRLTRSRPFARRLPAFRSLSTRPSIFVSLGRGAVFELGPEGRDYSDLMQLDELRALCLAAIRGDFRETVWFKGDEVIGGRGWAKVGSEEVGHRWRQVFTNPFRRTRKRLYAYEPYG